MFLKSPFPICTYKYVYIFLKHLQAIYIYDPFRQGVSELTVKITSTFSKFAPVLPD